MHHDLQTSLIGHPLLHHASVGSTNDLVKAQARAGHAEGLVIMADEQQFDLAAAGLGAFRDVAWRDDATLLLLTDDAPMQLDAPPSADLNVAALQSLRAFLGQQPGDDRIPYVP